jgi:hypothetical protein
MMNGGAEKSAFLPHRSATSFQNHHQNVHKNHTNNHVSSTFLQLKRRVSGSQTPEETARKTGADQAITKKHHKPPQLNHKTQRFI